MKRLVVNDALSQLGEVTMWHRLVEWLDAEFVGGDYATLPDKAKVAAKDASLVVRNASFFPPIETSCPQISLLQDIATEGSMRELQEAVIKSSASVVYNSEFTASKYESPAPDNVPRFKRIIPLPVDFSLFTLQNAFACQQALGLPDGCVLWVGASQGAAGHVKGFDTFRQVARLNPDISFVAVFKDAAPEPMPPNVRVYAKLSQANLVKVIGACRVGLCTSRTESQHLAGIEMGACGLPMVAPPVGIYAGGISGIAVLEPTVPNYTVAIRAMLAAPPNGQHVREFWRQRCDIPVVKAAWLALVSEVENGSA